MAMIYKTLNNFTEQLRSAITGVEGLHGQPMNVGDGTVTYGYGYTFIRNGTRSWERYDNLDDDLADIGITLTDAQKISLDEIADSLNRGDHNTDAHQTLIDNFATNFAQLDITEANAQILFNR